MRKTIKIDNASTIKLLALITALFCFLMVFFLSFNNIASVVRANATSAESMIVLDCASNRILNEKNAYSKQYNASTTKIVTAITVIENKDLNDIVTVDKSMVGIEGSSIYLEIGEKISVLDLLYGLMLQSGNDAATALAISTCGTIKDFALLMNKTAKKAGANSSNFINPHGLHDDNHYTTAYDLGLITTYALKNIAFKNIVATKTHSFKRQKLTKPSNLELSNSSLDNTESIDENIDNEDTNQANNQDINKDTNKDINQDNNKDTNQHNTDTIKSSEYTTIRYVFNNKNKILHSLQGGDGVKTGFTKKAGRCLVSSATRNDMQVVCVVLNCGPMFEDSRQLINQAFITYNHFEILPSYSYIGLAEIENSRTKHIKTYCKQAFKYPLKDSEKQAVVTMVEYYNLKAPIKRNQEVGEIKIYLHNRIINTQKLYSMDSAKSLGICDMLKDLLDEWF